MRSSPPSFAENDSVNGTYKGSLFKNLFKDRKTVLDGYPLVKKGLQFPEPILNFGSCKYQFKTTAIEDKVSCKVDDKEFQARYKKKTDQYDVWCKFNCGKGMFALVKYEERGWATGPAYVVGFDVLKGAVAFNAKLNCMTGVFKASTLFNADETVKGLKLAADYKLADALGNGIFTSPLKSYNFGMLYSSKAGVTSMGYNGEKSLVTLNHSLNPDSKTQALIEATAPLDLAKNVGPNSKDKGLAPTVALGVSYQLDKEHQLKARVNQNAQVQVMVKKDFLPHFWLNFGTCFDLNTPLVRPALGFKLVTKC